MTIVALTGGIGAGKSTVTARLAEHGARVIDADEVAREVVAPGTPALQAIVEAFGNKVLGADGNLNRAALGEIVFADPEARNTLNAIVHPAVKNRSQELFAEASANDPAQVIVYAVPLLVESRGADSFDLVVVVDAPASQRISRLVEHRGMTPAEATARVDAQASDDERLAIADVVLDASGSIENTLLTADQLASALATHWPDRLTALPTRFPLTSA